MPIKPFWTFIFLLFSILNVFSNPLHAKMDDSIALFFPKELKALQVSQTEFSVFWWNFAIVDPHNSQPSFSTAKKVCETLKSFVGNGESNDTDRPLRLLFCPDELNSFKEIASDWAKDLNLRLNLKSKEAQDQLLSQFQSTLTELSYVNSKDIFNLLRNDPAQSWQTYLSLSENSLPHSYSKQNGFLIDKNSQRILIPFQFATPPKAIHSAKLIQKIEALNKFDSTITYPLSPVHLLGPHLSSYRNETQVHEDLKIVSIIGSIVLIGFILFLVFSGRKGALLLVPPVFIAMTLAAFIVEWYFGSIHGLTLAFGSGIIGLAIDYGLHGAFSRSTNTWKSNAIGFITTLVALGIMIRSGIPLIRQMMLFSGVGLFLGFIFFYLLCKFAPKYFSFSSFAFKIPEFKGAWIFVLLCVGLATYFIQDQLFHNTTRLDLRTFNFELPKEKEISSWFFANMKNEKTYIVLSENQFFDIKKEQSFQKNESIRDSDYSWANSKNIRYEGLDKYLPSSSEQIENWESWQDYGCNTLIQNLSIEAKKVFSIFLSSSCNNFTNRYSNSLNGPAQSWKELKNKKYLNHLISDTSHVQLLTTNSPEQELQVQKRFPNAVSFNEAIEGFSISMKDDLQWMIPAALALCIFILFLYYRKAKLVIATLIPFFCGLGLFFAINKISGSEIDLISILALVMVFGFSLDYGVFSTDIYFHESLENRALIEQDVYSALSLAALTNILGFFPMLFAKHQVLHQFGMALFWGTIGTYLGTIWGVRKFILTEFQFSKSMASKTIVLILCFINFTSCQSITQKNESQAPAVSSEKPFSSDLIFPDGKYYQTIEVHIENNTKKAPNETIENPEKQSQNSQTDSQNHDFQFDSIVQKHSQEIKIVSYNSFGLTLFTLRDLPPQPLEFETSVTEIEKHKDFFLNLYPSIKTLFLNTKISDIKANAVISLNFRDVGKSDLIISKLDSNNIPQSMIISNNNFKINIETTKYELASKP